MTPTDPANIIYLDHAATTPLDPRVLEAMLPHFGPRFGNASSQHACGRRAATAVGYARDAVAAVLKAESREIVFTGGATESNNLALLGCARAPGLAVRRHFVTARTEHRAVLDPLRHLESLGYEVSWLPVSANGALDLDRLAAAIRPDTLLVSLMHANNETGVLHPLAEIGRLCRSRGVLFHTDATQTFGKESIDVDRDALDLVSFSAHKIHGPMGVGGLYVRRKAPRVRLAPLVHGGGHERGLRSGTVNVPGIVGLGAASLLADAARVSEQATIRALRDQLEALLVARIEGVNVHGQQTARLGTISNLEFVGTDAQSLMRRLPDLAVSTAAACSSTTAEPSHVLGAMGLDDAQIGGTLRLSLGRFTTASEIDQAVTRIVAAVGVERREGPTLTDCAWPDRGSGADQQLGPASPGQAS